MSQRKLYLYLHVFTHEPSGGPNTLSLCESYFHACAVRHTNRTFKINVKTNNNINTYSKGQIQRCRGGDYLYAYTKHAHIKYYPFKPANKATSKQTTIIFTLTHSRTQFFWELFWTQLMYFCALVLLHTIFTHTVKTLDSKMPNPLQ